MFPFIQQDTPSEFSTVPDALAQLAMGQPIVVLGSEDRENEGNIVFAAEFASPGVVAFTVRHSSGILCVAMTNSDCERLDLPQMCGHQDSKQATFTVSVDALGVESTGISAVDRSYTIKALASTRTTSEDLTRPGHVFPLRADTGGSLVRAGHAEAAVDLALLAGLRPIAAIAAIVNDDGSVTRRRELMCFAARHSLAIVAIDDVIAYRLTNETHVYRNSTPKVDLPQGQFRTVGYRSDISAHQIVALVSGDLDELTRPVVRVLPECLHAPLFGASVCTCDEQLATYLAEIGPVNSGILVFVSDPTVKPGLLDRLPGIDDAPSLATDAGISADQIINALITQVLRDLGVNAEYAQQVGSKMSICSTPGTRSAALDDAA